MAAVVALRACARTRTRRDSAWGVRFVCRRGAHEPVARQAVQQRTCASRRMPTNVPFQLMHASDLATTFPYPPPTHTPHTAKQCQTKQRAKPCAGGLVRERKRPVGVYSSAGSSSSHVSINNFSVNPVTAWAPFRKGFCCSYRCVPVAVAAVFLLQLSLLHSYSHSHPSSCHIVCHRRVPCLAHFVLLSVLISQVVA